MYCMYHNGTLRVDVFAVRSYQESKETTKLDEEEETVIVRLVGGRRESRGLELQYHRTELRNVEQRLRGSGQMKKC